MTKARFGNKLRQLFIGKHTLKQRVLTALLPAAALSFILFFFGPLDLSESAKNYVNYTPPDILPTCLKLWGITCLVLFLAAWIPGGKLHAWIASVYTGLALAFYIQGNFLNPDLGKLDGSAIPWQKYSDNALIGLGIFCCILVLPLLTHFFSRKFWEKFVVLVSAMLLIMQSVPLAMHLTRDIRDQNAGQQPIRYAANKADELKLGRKENIIVFILDNANPGYIEDALEVYPEMLDPLKDFIYFDDMNTEYHGTFPGATYLLTNFRYDCEHMAPGEYRDLAWHSEDAEAFYGQLHETGWTTHVYHNAAIVSGGAENEYGKVDNIIRKEGAEKFTVNLSVFKSLLKLSFFRYFPLIMKAPFQIYTEDLSAMRKTNEDETEWDSLESILKFWDEGISFGDHDKLYLTYHHLGAHGPFGMDANGRYRENSDVSSQLAGHFHMISEYLQHMKDMKIYDPATIIITADHGIQTDPDCIFMIKPAGQHQDAMTRSHAPVSQSEFMETVAQAAGLAPGQFGTSVFDIPEDEPRERCARIRDYDPEEPGNRSGTNFNVMKEYCYLGDRETLNRMIQNGEYHSLPMPESYY